MREKCRAFAMTKQESCGEPINDDEEGSNWIVIGSTGVHALHTKKIKNRTPRGKTI